MTLNTKVNQIHSAQLDFRGTAFGTQSELEGALSALGTCSLSSRVGNNSLSFKSGPLHHIATRAFPKLELMLARGCGRAGSCAVHNLSSRGHLVFRDFPRSPRGSWCVRQRSLAFHANFLSHLRGRAIPLVTARGALNFHHF